MIRIFIHRPVPAFQFSLQLGQGTETGARGATHHRTSMKTRPAPPRSTFQTGRGGAGRLFFKRGGAGRGHFFPNGAGRGHFFSGRGGATFQTGRGGATFETKRFICFEISDTMIYTH
jgi:hypothetical protein